MVRPPMKIERKATPDVAEEGSEPAEQVEEASVAGTEELDYVFPSVELLDAPKPSKEDVDDEELKANADLLRDTLLEFDVELESVSVTPGPVVTLYELVPATGVKISRIVSLENDIALKLAAKGIRIMAPIPGKSAVGVEIPNSNRSLVTIRSVINSNNYRDASAALPLAMGKTIAGRSSRTILPRCLTCLLRAPQVPARASGSTRSWQACCTGCIRPPSSW